MSETYADGTPMTPSAALASAVARAADLRACRALLCAADQLYWTGMGYLHTRLTTAPIGKAIKAVEAACSEANREVQTAGIELDHERKREAGAWRGLGRRIHRIRERLHTLETRLEA